MPEPPSDLRDELQRLGYLESRVDRFLSPRDTSRRARVMASVRLAILAVWPVLAAQAALHITADPLVLAGGQRFLGLVLVLFVVLGAALTALAFVVHSLVRGSAVAIVSDSLAWSVAILVLLHLGFSWLHVRETVAEGGARLNADCIAAAVLAAVGLVTARLFALSEGAVSGIHARALGWPTRIGFAVVIVSIISVRLIAPASPDGDDEDLRFAPQGTGQQLIWVIIDGLHPSLYRHALSAGWMPRLTPGPQGEMHVPVVIPEATTRMSTPAELWTTVTTGAPTDRHGVHLFARTRVKWSDRDPWGQRLLATVLPYTLPLDTTPLSARERRVPTVGEIVADKDYRVISVGNWCTGPVAADDPRWIVSDRALRRALVDPDPVPATEEFAPAAIRGDIENAFAELRSLAPAERAAIVDRVTLRLTRALALKMKAEKKPADLIVVTLSGTDLNLRAGSRRKDMEAPLRTLGDELRAFVSALEPGPSTGLLITGARAGQENGFLIASGSPFHPGPAVGEALRPGDVFPLALRILGFPRAENLPGRDVDALLDLNFLGTYPARTVPRYADRVGSPGEDSLADEYRHLEALRTLGYVREGGSR